MAAFIVGFSPLHAGDRHIGPVTDIAQAGSHVFSVSQGGLYEGVGQGLERVLRPPFRLTSVAVVRDLGAGAIVLLLGGGEPGISGMIAVWHRGSPELKSLKVSSDLVYDVAVRPDGRVGAMACADHRVMTVALPALSEGSLIRRHQHTAAARAVAFSPSGMYLASVGLDGLVVVSKRSSGANGPVVQIQDHTSKVDCLAFSPDSTLIASGARDGKVRIHTVEGRLIRTYRGLSREIQTTAWGVNPFVESIAWGGNPPALVAGTSKGTLYHLSSTDDRWQRLGRSYRHPIYSLAFGGSGNLLVGTHDLWDLPHPLK